MEASLIGGVKRGIQEVHVQRLDCGCTVESGRPMVGHSWVGPETGIRCRGLAAGRASGRTPPEARRTAL